MIFIESIQEHISRAREDRSYRDEFIAKLSKEVERVQENYSAFISIAKTFDSKNERGVLAFLPVSVKDNICTKDLPTTAGSKILKGYRSKFDATSVKKARDEGALIIGKTAMDEFGFGTFSVNTPFQVPKNPLDIERSCGGSSGGAGCFSAATALPHVALAESTGGSITCPASFTGTVGLTPTYGKISRWGLIDYANSLDRIGMIGKRVEDLSFFLDFVAGKDERDPTSSSEEAKNSEKQTIGVPKEYIENVDEKIKGNFWKVVEKLEKEGIKYEEFSMPFAKYAIPAYYIIATCEASTNLAKFSGTRFGLNMEQNESFDEYILKVRDEGFGEEAKRRILLGTYARMAGYRNKYYIKATKIRRKIIDEFKSAFLKYDAVVSPSMPIVAPRFEEIKKLTPSQNYMMDILTVGPSLAGTPMLSVPVGKVEGMPTGIHLIGKHFNEKGILKLGKVVEMVV